MIHLNSSLEIKISTKKPFQKSSYQKVFSFDDLKRVSNYFSLFKNISDIIPNIKAMLENEKTRDLGADANSKIIKLCLFLFSFTLYFTVNALFFNDTTMHKIYDDQGISI